MNKYQPHIFVLPEDDANSQIANGFLLHPDLDVRAIQVLPNAGGWAKVLDQFEKSNWYELGRWPNRFIVLVFDFDGRPERRDEVQARVPAEFRDRVLLLGVSTEPEDLRRQAAVSLESIGKNLAKDCRHSTETTWQHPLLRDNLPGVRAFAPLLRQVLFP